MRAIEITQKEVKREKVTESSRTKAQKRSSKNFALKKDLSSKYCFKLRSKAVNYEH